MDQWIDEFNLPEKLNRGIMGKPRKASEGKA